MEYSQHKNIAVSHNFTQFSAEVYFNPISTKMFKVSLKLLHI